MTNAQWMIEIDQKEFGMLGGIHNPALRRTTGPDGNWRYYKPPLPVGRPGRSAKADRRLVANWIERFQAARSLKGN